MAETEVPVPPQYKDAVVIDFRNAMLGPRGYKMSNKRKMEEKEEQVLLSTTSCLIGRLSAECFVSWLTMAVCHICYTTSPHVCDAILNILRRFSEACLSLIRLMRKPTRCKRQTQLGYLSRAQSARSLTSLA